MKHILTESTRKNDIRKLEKVETLLKQMNEILSDIRNTTDNQELKADIAGNVGFLTSNRSTGSLSWALKKAQNLADMGSR